MRPKKDPEAYRRRREVADFLSQVSMDMRLKKYGLNGTEPHQAETLVQALHNGLRKLGYRIP